MFKNVASQKLTLLALDSATGRPKTGDAANLTAYVSKDDGSVTALTDTSATELDATNAPGLYSFDLAQAETNADKLLFSGKSSTSGIDLVPLLLYTMPANAGLLSIDGNGRVDVIKVAGTTQTAGDVAALLATLSSKLVKYVQLLARRDAAIATDNATELAAINANGGSGTGAYDNATDSVQALRDNELTPIKAKTNNLPASPAAVGDAMTLTSGERDSIAAAILDLADAIETGVTTRKALRAMAAILTGKVSGAGTTSEVFKGIDSSTTRATVTVDEDGNRSAVSLNL